MNLAKKLKLYRVNTILKYIPKSWENSKKVKSFSGKNRVSLFFSLLYWFYFYGFDYNDYCTFRFWNLSSSEKKSYISLKRNDQLRFKLSTPGAYKIFLDKAIFNRNFKDFVNREWIEIDSNNFSLTDIRSFLQNHKTAFLKPISDFGGHGVRKITQDITDETLSSMISNGSNYILEDRIENSDSLKSIAPGSLNTIRIVTLIDKEGQVNILACVLRMGNGTAHTDNYHDGGMACAINPHTGTLVGNAHGMDCKEFTVHPFSGIKFDGLKIEDFGKCLETAKSLAKVVPGARYVGWDLAITPTGIEVIEGNIPPGEDITQIATGRGLWYEIIKKI